MFELLLGLLCLVFVLAVVAVVGHGLWVFVATLFGVSQSAPPKVKRRGERTCAGCRYRIDADEAVCPECGLEQQGKAAAELRDLEIAGRTVERLVDLGKATPELGAALGRSIEARQNELAPPEPRLTPVEQIEAWFGDERGRGLSTDEKKQALALARMMQPADFRRLSAPALLGLARLLTTVGLLTRACQVYRVLYDAYPESPICENAANEAIRAARQSNDRALADELIAIIAPPVVPIVEPFRPVGPTPTPVLSALPPVVAPAPVVVMEAPAPVEIQAPPPAPAPRRGLAEWIAVFMEQRNILWGELIGGTLIVGCSIALVISLRQTLEQIQYSPFFILAAITSALLAAGFYTLHHWKLESTSRGMLLIGMLLVPLDFMVFVELTRGEEVGWFNGLIGAAAGAGFGFLLHRATRILIETPLEIPAPSAWLVTLAMLSCAGAHWLAPRWIGDGNDLAVYVLTLGVVLASGLSIGWILLRLAALASWRLSQLVGLLIALGSTTFAACVVLSFPIHVADDLGRALVLLSPALTLLGVPLLLAGALMHRKLERENTEHFATWRTLGTGVALLGVFVMFGGFAVAAESPVHRWLSGLINVAVLLATAWSLRLPVLHVPVQAYLAILLALGGRVHLDGALLNEPTAALRLCGLFVLQAIVAEALLRGGRRLDAHFYAVGGGVSTALALLLILRIAGHHPGAAAIVCAVAALTWYTANLRWRFAELTYVCSLVLVGAIFFTFQHAASFRVIEQWLWTLLTHATICLVANTALRRVDIDWLRDRFRIPFGVASLTVSVGAAGLLFVEQFDIRLSAGVSSIACLWLAALWLTIAMLERWPILFGVFQVALSCAWLFGAAGWQTHHGWDWCEPFSLQVYAFGLALLSLGWELARLTLRARPWPLLSPSFMPVDRVVSGTLVIAQYALTALLVAWSAGQELSHSADLWRIFPEAWHQTGFSIWAWLVPLVLTAVVILWLRELGWHVPVFALTLLLLTVPMVVAGTWFHDTKAAASALRWGLAACYLVSAALLWCRHRLGERTALIPARGLRGLLFAAALMPVLLITLDVVVTKLGRGSLPGPLEGVFTVMGGPTSLLVPLALLCVALAGHGFRERLDYYLGGAGLLINAVGVGALFLALQRLGERFDQTWVAVDALLLSAAVAWVWSMIWTAVAGALERDERRPLLDSPWLTFNSFVGASLFGGVLLIGLQVIVFGGDDASTQWVIETGSLRGWVVFALVAGGAGLLLWYRRASLPLHLFGVVGLTTVGLLACSFAMSSLDSAFIALMFGAGVFASAWAWCTLLLDAEATPRWLRVTAERWEGVCYAVIGAVGAILLGGRALFVAELRLWSAEAIVLSAVAFALLAYQRKRELWATLASVALLPASTILVIHFDPDNPHLTLCVVQTVLATLGVMSLLRLGLQRWIHEERRAAVQLDLQIAGGVLANGFLAAIALAALLAEPREPNLLLGLRGERIEFLLVSGWLALLTNAIAAVWHVSRVQPRMLVHVAGVVGLLVGVGCAVSVDLLVEQDWLAHHVLTLSWTLHAALLLALSWLSHACTALGPRSWIEARRTHTADWLRGCLPAGATRLWVTLGGALVVFFALRAAWLEPERVAWPIANTLAVSILLGATAIWTRAVGYVYASGLLLNVIGVLFCAANRGLVPADQELGAFAFVQVFCFGIASLAWSLIDRLTHANEDADALPFTQAALQTGLHLLALVVVAANAFHLMGQAAQLNGVLAWVSMSVIALAAIVDGARPQYRGWLRYPLYVCGLSALGLLLHGWDLGPADWGRLAMLLLAGYVLLVVVIARVIQARSALETWFDVAAYRSPWFWNVQIVSVGIVFALSLWITLTQATAAQRLCGAAALALSALALFLLVEIWPRLYSRADSEGHRLLPYHLVLTLALVMALETGWALLALDVPALWLQRTSAAFTVIGAALLLCRFAAPRWLDAETWGRAGTQMGAVLGIGAVGLLVMFLGEQVVFYERHAMRTPQLLVLAIPSGLAILGLAGLSLSSALSKKTDPYGIEGDWRSIYVYVTELLVLALVAHLRLNVPKILPSMLGQYWYLSVMALAFVAVALGETLARRGLSILAEPLKRSAFVLALVPVLAFRFAALVKVPEAFDAAPGLMPFLEYLRRMGEKYEMEALCWLLLGIFLGWQTRLRGSANYGIAGLLAVNFGVWVLLGNQPAATFLTRPQLWLIPLGLIILLAEHINRDQLGFWPSLSIRYTGLAAIYLSSMAEMFMEHLSPLFAVVLAVIAVTGMLLGILLRVRAFLLTGFLSLLMVVFAQIWQAAVVKEHNWVWWASGIVLGVLILALFAIFEKHKSEVLKALDGMKQWK